MVYDQNFRQEAAESGNLDWAKVDPSIYTQCFTGATQTYVEGCLARTVSFNTSVTTAVNQVTPHLSVLNPRRVQQ